MTPYRNRRRPAATTDKQIHARGNRAARAASRRRAAPALPVHAQRLAAALQALSHGLPNPWDESTDYFHGFVAAMPASTKLGVESFRAALKIGARYDIALASANEVLSGLSKAEDDGEEAIAGFRQLATVMRATLHELSLAFARGNGVTRVRVWLFGRAEDGTLVGLRSISTET
jgi:hypothetical protein